MTNRELDELLKSAQAPGRDESYWSDFPARITVGIFRRKAGATKEVGPALRRDPRRALSWGFVAAAACALAVCVTGLWRGRESGGTVDPLARAKKYYHEIEALFPHQVRAIVFDRHGPHLVLAERADVPISPPYYLKICGPAGCEAVVTFSGQRIPVNGEDVEVLADARGQVMLVGNNQVWADSKPSDTIRVESTLLSASL